MTWEPPEAQTLQEQAALMHELYASLVAEGFTEHQALHIVMAAPCCQFNYREE
jgi:hypothetical protein